MFRPAACRLGKEHEMKKIYLVKKDPKAANSPENWNILDGYEFKLFIQTDEGRKRRPNFAVLNAVDSGDYMLIIECAEGDLTLLKRQHDMELVKYRKEKDLEILPLHAIPLNGELCDGSEVIRDDNFDLEEMVIRRMEIEDVLEAMSLLSDSDKALIEAIYLKRTHTEKSYAEYLGVKQQTVHKQKVRILQKLRELLDEK